MYLKFTGVLSAAWVLAACDPSVQAESERINTRKSELVAEIGSFSSVSANGSQFRVGIHDSQNWAAIVPVSKKPSVTGTMLETIAANASGCTASFSGDVVSTIPGYSKDKAFPLTRPVKVGLSC